MLLASALLLALPTPSAPPSERLVKVYGDLATAERVAIIVPGADTTVKTFENATFRPGGAARSLLAQARALDPGARLAVIAWLGYDSPPTVSLSAITESNAAAGGRALRRTVSGLRAGVPVTLLCHSYGSVVCAHAAPAPGIADVAVFGSPGLGSERRPGFWAGRGASDWIAKVPHVRLGPLGFGDDPMTYATRTFDAGPGGHSDYFRPGTASLRNLALIALGRTAEVTHD